ERFAPRAAKYDTESSFPYENYAELREAGLLALTVPKDYGGLGADPIAYAHTLREIAKGCASTALTFNMHSTVATFIAALGTEAQKRRYFADVVGRGALIPKTDAGVKIEGIWNATGMRGTISHTIRYDSTVGAERIIGTPGSLLSIDLSGFALGYAATYLGIGEAAFEYMVEYAKTKTLRPSTESLAHHPLVQRTVAETGTAVRAARLLLHEAARVRMTGDTEATMLAVNQAKAYCTEVGLEATGKALRLAGGRGILKELPLERWHRDALAGPVMPPSNDRCLETAGKAQRSEEHTSELQSRS